MPDFDKIYDDFLYDCHVANQRLTDEDWMWYGKEEHHVEVPDCEGGVLTPLNSQDLTLYQHWVAGVLQSEVRGRCCFAFVPCVYFVPLVESLRKKWQVAKAMHMVKVRDEQTPPEQLYEWRKAAHDAFMKATTFEERKENSKKANEAWLEKTTSEQRSEAARQRALARTPEQLSEWSRIANSARLEKTTSEQRSESARRGRAKLTPEERSAAAYKAWETKRRKKAKREGGKPSGEPPRQAL